MPTLSAIVTLSADAETLTDVETFLLRSKELGVPSTMELLDGGHTSVEGFDRDVMSFAVISSRPTLGDLQRWLEAARSSGAEGDASVVVGGDTLAVDVDVLNVEPIDCGECVRPERQFDLLVDLHVHQ